MKRTIDYAGMADFGYLQAHDEHVGKDMIKKKIADREIITVRLEQTLVGWLRYGYFWDSIPFMNMLLLEEPHRNAGHGSALLRFWETEMQAAGHAMLMTSTLADEQAQFFYRKHGYRDAGCLLLENEALEILFTKTV